MPHQGDAGRVQVFDGRAADAHLRDLRPRRQAAEPGRRRALVALHRRVLRRGDNGEDILQCLLSEDNNEIASRVTVGLHHDGDAEVGGLNALSIQIFLPKKCRLHLTLPVAGRHSQKALVIDLGHDWDIDR